MKLRFFAAFVGFGLIASVANATTILVAPVKLGIGDTVSSLPNGGSTGDDKTTRTIRYDTSNTETFADGLSIVLRARVIHYSDEPSILHPGDLFDDEVRVLSGSLVSVSFDSYGSDVTTSVKVCGIDDCGGSGADGVLPTSVSRSYEDKPARPGDTKLTWDFSGLSAGQHSANLQVFTNARGYVDPLAFFTDSNGNTFSVGTVAPFISSVPLPPALPMLGAAVLALGAVGYGVKRMGSAAA